MGYLISTLIAMSVMASMLATLYSSIEDGIRNVSNAVFASQTAVIGDAFARYVKDHSAQIAQFASPVAPFTITTDTLAQGNYLPSGTSVGNAYQQRWVAKVLEPQPGKLQTMLFTLGGDPIPIDQIVPIAAQSTSQQNLGGFVPYANQAGDTTLQPTAAVGINGSFRQDLTAYGSPGPGHLAMMLAVADASADNGFLYRVDMSQIRPELNNMQTNLGMTDAAGNKHDINGAGAVNAVTGAFSGNIGTAGFDPQGGLPAGYRGGVHTWDVYAEGTIAAGNQGKLNASMDYQGHIIGQQLSLANAAVPNTACTNYGVNATSVSANADGSGQMLSCQWTGQGARWMPIGGPILRYGYFTVADASFVPAPNCPSGAQQLLQLSLQGFTVNQTATVNGGPATWTGNGWIVHLQDGAGNSLPRTATVGTYCYYGT
ncbi:shufflon system plasmid conjugative transfer pilus tip adhesin PilV [Burkholderia glumae]|uniref:shufflon system plasmid conjugative transfer pilus tip adhesin PilV n=1 Tax=Burkholderia glumae TaxID=337 RepID=UPI0020CE1446|nr:shufflon system plasmid conjugative transfer pilus tip adhesin PilV [Burkholderia glumae]MCQ0031461.1 shufflon system plasmid conjugative transfer pilus tip adhesin PilV [Burkholderia glumae]MCQ0035113.1 shufflon system plasmid conjugative transfer pilus tip adhesin PilV [Burkholderia glumae]